MKIFVLGFNTIESIGLILVFCAFIAVFMRRVSSSQRAWFYFVTTSTILLLVITDFMYSGYKIEYVDHVSYSMFVMTQVIMFIIAIYYLSPQNNMQYGILPALFISQALLTFLFLVDNIFLFFILFESAVLPMFFLIGVFGHDNKVYAAFKILLYTACGSLLMLVSICVLTTFSGETSMNGIAALNIQADPIMLNILFAGFLIAFLIKLPSFPFHTWLPDAHVQAPTVGSVILAAILLKIGGYGIYKIIIMFPDDICANFQIPMVTLGVISMIYGSLLSFAQTNIKKVIAYSSVAHMGYVLIGFFSLTEYGIIGAVFQMIGHAFVSAGLFFVVGILYSRVHTYDIAAYGGLNESAPTLHGAFRALVFAAVALPGTMNFIGELLVIMSVFEISLILCILLLSGLLLSPMYMLYVYKDISCGDVREIMDIDRYIAIALWMLFAIVVVFGIFPFFLYDFLAYSVNIRVDFLNNVV